MKPLTMTFLCLFFLVCDQQADGSDDSVEGSGEEALPRAFASGASPLATGDPWLELLDHSSLEEIENGFELLAYDEEGFVIGTISIAQTSSDTMSIAHEYPRACERDATSSICADTLRISLNLADEFANVYASAAPGLFTARATAIIDRLPPGSTEGKIRCVLTILAASSTCVIGSAAGPIGIPPCVANLAAIACACPEGFKKAWPDLDWDEYCD